MSSLTLTGAGPEVASAFSPLSLSPAVWYDFSTTAGGGAAIASISDLSGNARTASQGTAGSRPTSQSAVINGLNVGRFDGVDDLLSITPFTLAQPLAVYAVVTGAANRYFGGTNFRVGYDATPQANNFAGATLIGGSAATATPKVITSIFNGVSSVIRINGTQVAAGDAGTGGFSVGAGVGIGSEGDASQFWAGDIGELFVVASSAPSTSGENYLRTKWGTP